MIFSFFKRGAGTEVAARKYNKAETPEDAARVYSAAESRERATREVDALYEEGLTPPQAFAVLSARQGYPWLKPPERDVMKQAGFMTVINENIRKGPFR